MSLTERLLAEIPKEREILPPARDLGIDQSSTLSADVAEAAVLAGALRNADYAERALAILKVSDFDLEWRQRVWAAIGYQHRQGRPITAAALYRVLGPELWQRLAEESARVVNPHMQDYVTEVAEWGKRRRATARMLKEIERTEGTL